MSGFLASVSVWHSKNLTLRMGSSTRIHCFHPGSSISWCHWNQNLEALFRRRLWIRQWCPRSLGRPQALRMPFLWVPIGSPLSKNPRRHNCARARHFRSRWKECRRHPKMAATTKTWLPICHRSCRDWTPCRSPKFRLFWRRSHLSWLRPGSFRHRCSRSLWFRCMWPWCTILFGRNPFFYTSRTTHPSTCPIQNQSIFRSLGTISTYYSL